MRLRDRIAAWFGYVPINSCEGCTLRYIAFHEHTPEYAWLQADTETTVTPRPQIIVSADFKRGIPCS